MPLFDLLIYIDLSLKLPFEPEASRFVCFEITPTKFCSVLNFIKLSKSYYRTSYMFPEQKKSVRSTMLALSYIIASSLFY